MLNLMLLSNIQ